MVNPDDLVDAWVDALSSISDLTDALGGADGNILGYKDGFPLDVNLRRQIIAQPQGTILVVYMGTDKARFPGGGGAWSFRHNFKFYVKAQEKFTDVSYSHAQLWAHFVNGIPQGGELPLLQAEIHPDCDSMSREGPSSQRQSLLVSNDGETMDYFEWTATLIEKAA